MTNPTIQVPNMCQKHQALLVTQAGYRESDPWQALIIATQIALFQAATCDDRVYRKIGGDVLQIAKLGCLACEKPDAFGAIVEIAKLRDLGQIKTLGEKWVQESQKGTPP